MAGTDGIPGPDGKSIALADVPLRKERLRATAITDSDTFTDILTAPQKELLVRKMLSNEPTVNSVRAAS